MKLPKSILTIFIISCFHLGLCAQVPGIYNFDSYLPFLKNKKIALVVNQNSVVNDIHVLDTLLKLDIDIKKIFSPEHGFSGSFNAGEYVNDSVYDNSIPIISLYGKNKEFKDDDLTNIDVMIFDIQDVGVRFYTYISTLHYVMEGCAKNKIKLIVLDRANPHAHYIDGPVLQKKYTSFVGMHPVPIVYGMTIGEYALMINGEGWLDNNMYCDIEVVPVSSYSRFDFIDYELSPPSPNLRTMNSIFLYPSLCLFEGTSISVGRGTEHPFEIFGSPFLDIKNFSFEFKPQSNIGSKNPKYNNELCYGWSLIYSADDNHDGFVTLNERRNNSYGITGGKGCVVPVPSSSLQVNSLNLNFLIYTYRNTDPNHQSNFFNNYFNKLAGNQELQQQIIEGVSEYEIRKTWETDLLEFQSIRGQYLLYD